MKKGLTEIIFILDRSGSMGGLEADTIGGFNSLVEEQEKEAKRREIEAYFFRQSASLGALVGQVLSSPAFFEGSG